ncbi:SGNH/GDSL hydrolase family protein [Actinomadura parmotrematis]|uniref:SGNH/GDSL hydrolase family protein n=1 Tax=Actinomadura parmotrematis TaxID=2864039 RepID=A0ABS7FZM4_9ACTN|nr:SGNH/GDSL hydrolase family protein [Actinomadura parmotrematis]MBW8485007.1 SGNH/GDSL hydrolase family protein [Actinomadura parmotrematis]
MHLKKALGVASAVAALLALGSPVAARADGTAAAQGKSYVALGDSFTAGPLIPRSAGGVPGCLRSDHAYPSLVAAGLGARLTDASCSGAETEHMSSPQTTPLGVNPPQLDALAEDTGLVTLGIGGNDVGFGQIAVTCGLLSVKDHAGAPCTARYGDELARRVDATAPKVAAVLAEIHRRSPRARVLVVGYLRLVPEAPGCWPVVPLAAGDLAFLDAAERRLNAMLEKRAAAAGATFVDAYRDGLGHDMCAPPGRKWVEGIALTSAAAPFHPNAAGMREVAARVAAAVPAARSTDA